MVSFSSGHLLVIDISPEDSLRKRTVLLSADHATNGLLPSMKCLGLESALKSNRYTPALWSDLYIQW